MHPYEFEEFFIVTKHGKEEALQRALPFPNAKVVCFNANTDIYGTFSPEKPREMSLKETLKAKSNLIDKKDVRLIISSEGSFGPHPECPFLNLDHEILYFHDRDLNIEHFVEEFSMETNLAEKSFSSIEGVYEFLKLVQFPSHAVIIFNKNLSFIRKGIREELEMRSALEECWSNGDEAIIQTDMRANYNPTRMRIIELAANKLFQHLKSLCPSCFSPCFAPVEYVRGLNCQICGRETNCIKEVIYCCVKCGHKESNQSSEEKKLADPGFCDFCNP